MRTAADRRDDGEYRDVTATELKRTFGEVLEQVIRGRRVRVTRHGRAGERVVLLREADLAALEARALSPLDALREEFDRLVERMQSPEAKQAAADVGTASAEEIAAAAVKKPATRG